MSKIQPAAAEGDQFDPTFEAPLMNNRNKAQLNQNHLIDNTYDTDEEIEEEAKRYKTSSKSMKFTSSKSSQHRADSVFSAQTKDDLREFEVNYIYKKKDKRIRYIDNRIATSKYNVITFLPKNLFQQFTKMANAYFLMMAFLEGKPAMLLPLSFVVIISMIKDIFEDLKRHQTDNLENNSKVMELNPHTGDFEETIWQKINVGRVVKIKGDEFFPADLILLNSSGPKGICYVETKNLDGETNLKLKQAQKETIEWSKSDKDVMRNFTGSIIECEKPNEVLYKFEGNMSIQGTKIGFGENQILLRGSSLRNTEWIYGLVVFTGHESKIMMNSVRTKAKYSKLERATNFYILLLVSIQMLICITAALFNFIWTLNDLSQFPYLDLEQENKFLSFAVSFGVWFLSFVNFVPISLMVTLECVKFVQGYYIQQDYMMYDLEKDMPAKAQSSNLNEELGMVHYVFSDKTGTLTKNIMEFKKFTAGEIKYGTDNPKPKIVDKTITNVNFDDLKAFEHLSEPQHHNHAHIRRVVELLGLCHTVIVEEKNGKMVYNSQSPDELALINAAKHFGFNFKGRDEDNNLIIEDSIGNENGQGQDLKFSLLTVIEFTSTRKRMTVVVRGPDGRIRVMCKGADSVIQERLKGKQRMLEKTNFYLEAFAKEGLRTLLLAEKEISEEFFINWDKKYKRACTALSDREEKMAAIAEQLEVEFELVGSTAIEDKLQDDLADTISFIKEAGIKMWVLTGDKIETAINIGYSCELLSSDMEMFIIDQKATNDIRTQILSHRRDQKLTKLARENAVIVSGESLLKITRNETVRNDFLELAEEAAVVLCCRVSPKQKAEIVTMVKLKNKELTTLAIGDGANDVNMIVAAHIGVGISGLEGQQASRASDYAIGQFRFLKNLMFCHGREAYRKNSYLIAYQFYKNVLFVFPVFWFGFFSVFSGTAIYENLLYQFFNLFFTSTPISWFAVYDWQFEKKEFLKNPKYYKIGFRNECFNKYIFWRWIIYAVFQALLVLYVCFWSLEASQDQNGKFGELSIDGQFVYTGVVTLVNVKILTSTHSYTFWSFFFSIGSILVYMLFFWLINLWPENALYCLFAKVFIHSSFYFALLFCSICLVMVDIGLNLAHEEIYAMTEKREIQQQQRLKILKSQDSAVYYRRVTNYAHRGFAFSGEAGNAPQVTEKLKTAGFMQKLIPSFLKKKDSRMPSQTSSNQPGYLKAITENLLENSLDNVDIINPGGARGGTNPNREYLEDKVLERDKGSVSINQGTNGQNQSFSNNSQGVSNQIEKRF